MVVAVVRNLSLLNETKSLSAERPIFPLEITFYWNRVAMYHVANGRQDPSEPSAEKHIQIL